MQRNVEAPPYNGPAPEPRRFMAASPGAVDSDSPAITNEMFTVDPKELTPGSPNPGAQTYSSPPPENPDMASDLAELKQRMGELVQAIGSQKQEYERRLTEERLRSEAAFASQQNFNGPTFDGNDDETAITPKSLHGILGQFAAVQAAQTIRLTLGITPQEEASVMQNYPNFQNVPEPRKTELLREAVLLMRQTQPGNGESRSNGAVGRQAQPQRTLPPTRNAARTVPATEVQGGYDSFEEPQAGNALAQAQADYAAAGQLQNPKARMAARKLAMRKSQAALGLSDEEFAKLSWSQQ